MYASGSDPVETLAPLTAKSSTASGSQRLNAVWDNSSTAAARLRQVLGFDLAHWPNKLHSTFVGRVPMGRIAASIKTKPRNITGGYVRWSINLVANINVNSPTVNFICRETHSGADAAE